MQTARHQHAGVRSVRVYGTFKNTVVCCNLRSQFSDKHLRLGFGILAVRGGRALALDLR